LPVVCFQSDHIRFVIVPVCYAPWVAKLGRKAPAPFSNFKKRCLFPENVPTQNSEHFLVMLVSPETTKKSNLKKIRLCFKQARTRGGQSLPKNSFALPGKCVWHSLKVLDILESFWTPLWKLFAHPGVPSWLQRWLPDIFLTTRQCLMPVCCIWFSKNLFGVCLMHC